MLLSALSFTVRIRLNQIFVDPLVYYDAIFAPTMLDNNAFTSIPIPCASPSVTCVVLFKIS